MKLGKPKVAPGQDRNAYNTQYAKNYETHTNPAAHPLPGIGSPIADHPDFVGRRMRYSFQTPLSRDAADETNNYIQHGDYKAGQPWLEDK